MSFRWLDGSFVLLLLGLLIIENLAGFWTYKNSQQLFFDEWKLHRKTESQILALRIQYFLETHTEQQLTHQVLQEFVQRQNAKTLIGIYKSNGTKLVEFIPQQNLNSLAKELPQSISSNNNNQQVQEHKSYLTIQLPLINNKGFVGTAYFVFQSTETNLSEAALRLVYELPLWLLGILILYWIGKNLLNLMSTRLSMEGSSQSYSAQFRIIMDSYQQTIDHLQLKGEKLDKLVEKEKVRADISENFSNRLVASLPGAFIVIASDGIVSVTNIQARNLFKNPDSSFISYKDFFSTTPKIIQLIDRALNTGKVEYLNDIFLNTTNKQYFLEASASPIPGKLGTSHGVMCLVNDITEITQLRKNLQTKETLINLGEMAAGIAHEFKNSLATILGYSQILEKEANPHTTEAAKSLRQETFHLSEIVTDFLNFARQQPLSFSPIDLHELLEICIDRLVIQANKKNIEIHLIGDFPTIPVDVTLLSRAFINLIQNAIEAITEQSKQRLITISCITSVSKYCQILISDTGNGIPESDLPNIFIPFFTTKIRGYGIGLALVQKIFTAHNGRIEVESSHQGTIFKCYLPTTID